SLLSSHQFLLVLPAPHSFPTRRSSDLAAAHRQGGERLRAALAFPRRTGALGLTAGAEPLLALAARVRGRRQRELQVQEGALRLRSEEHTSELQSHLNLVCRLLLEKKKN